MRNRHRHSGQRIDALRLTIDCLPVSTRKAMLRGLQTNERIIVGAYVDDRGGVCPMLAAHRCGGRTDFLSFAKSWDRFTRASGSSRQATDRELRILIGHLEASLEADEGLQLERAIREHVELRERGRRESRRRLSEDADPAGNIIARRLRSLKLAYRASPGRTNIISGTTQAGETLRR
jgi:hypothetical protein